MVNLKGGHIMLANIIVFLIVFGIIFAAVRHIYKAKKSGVQCIGCPEGSSCSCGCCDDEDSNDKK